MKQPSGLRHLVIAAAMCFLFGVGACAAPPTLPDGRTTNAPRKNMVVQINNMSVQPEVVRITPGGSVAWDSWSDYTAVISFPISIRESFTCTQLRPDFTANGDRLISIPISGDDENLVTPCPLAIGTYPYRVLLSQDGAETFNPQLTLQGTVMVVEPTARRRPTPLRWRRH